MKRTLATLALMVLTGSALLGLAAQQAQAIDTVPLPERPIYIVLVSPWGTPMILPLRMFYRR